MSEHAGVYLVREYDWELQEVNYVAATLDEAMAWVEQQCRCIHEPGFHSGFEGWSLEDCIANRRRGFEERRIQHWLPGNESPTWEAEVWKIKAGAV